MDSEQRSVLQTQLGFWRESVAHIQWALQGCQHTITYYERSATNGLLTDETKRIMVTKAEQQRGVMASLREDLTEARRRIAGIEQQLSDNV